MAAMNVTSACFYLGSNMRSVHGVKVFASENLAVSKIEEDKVKLGGSDLKVSRLGLGAWSWGDTGYWNNSEWDDAKTKAAKSAFDVSIDGGITLFDTAEVYGSWLLNGAVNSETLLGSFIKERKQKDSEVEVAVATKFAALPWRLGRQSVVKALKDSLSRLGLSSVELYQLHWPGIWGNEGYIDGIGDAVEQGLVKAVGVSNYDGVLTGKYTPENPPSGPRGKIYTPEFLTRLQPLLKRIQEIGQGYSKTNTGNLELAACTRKCPSNPRSQKCPTGGGICWCTRLETH